MRVAEAVGEQDLVIHSGHYEIQSKKGGLIFTSESRYSSLLQNVSFHSPRVHMCNSLGLGLLFSSYSAFD